MAFGFKVSGFLVSRFLGFWFQGLGLRGLLGGSVGHHRRLTAAHVLNQRTARRTNKRARPAFDTVHQRDPLGAFDVVRLNALA